MAGLIRSILTLALLLTLLLGVASLVLAARNAAADDDQNYRLDSSANGTVSNNADDYTHGTSLAGSSLMVISALLGLALVLTRNLHRRFLTLVWKFTSLSAIALLSLALGVW